MSVETRPRTGSAPTSGATEEIRLTRRALRQAERDRDADTPSPVPGGTPDATTAATEVVAAGSPTALPRLPRRTSVLPPGRTVYVASRRAIPEPATWSARTLLVLATLCVLTLVAGTALVARTVTSQRLSTEGSRAAAALSAALEEARTDVAMLADAVEAAQPLATYAAGLADAMAPRTADLSDDAIAAVATAVADLEVLVAGPVTEPALPARLADLSRLPQGFVSSDAGTRDQLREAVAAQLERLPALGDQATDRADTLTDAIAAVRAAIGMAIRVAAETAQATLGATPEAYADSRARFEATVAALVALGDAPELDAATRQAFDAHFVSADVLRRSHEEAVQARELAERAAAEEAAAAAELEAAERAAAEQAEKRPWWWDGGRRPGGD